MVSEWFHVNESCRKVSIPYPIVVGAIHWPSKNERSDDNSQTKSDGMVCEEVCCRERLAGRRSAASNPSRFMGREKIGCGGAIRTLFNLKNTEHFVTLTCCTKDLLDRSAVTRSTAFSQGKELSVETHDNGPHDVTLSEILLSARRMPIVTGDAGLRDGNVGCKPLKLITILESENFRGWIGREFL